MDQKRAKVLVDPMRREMLRLLAHREMTESQLAGALGLSDAAVGHHLRILKKSGLIRIARRRIEKHGITQKFYETNALFYAIDSQEMPLEIERYLMPMNLERVRGVIAAFNILSNEPGRVSTMEIEAFSRIMTSAILQSAPKYSARSNLDREELMGLIYRDALSHSLKKKKDIPEKVLALYEQITHAGTAHGHIEAQPG